MRKLRRAKPALQTALQLVAVPGQLDHKTQDRLSRREGDRLCSRTPHLVEPYRTLGLGRSGSHRGVIAPPGRVLSAAVMPVPIKRALVLLIAPLLAVGITACASTTSTSSFKGENRAVAQAIANLQTEATAGEAKKICASLLASAVTERLNSAHGGCTQALKGQLAQVDTPELTVQEVQQYSATSAGAQVKSTYAGKSKVRTITLVKEAGKWKISKLG